MTETSTPPTSTPPPDTGPRVTRDQMRDISTLRRARDQRMVGGVAAGLSRHFDVDPILVRVAFAALTLFAGAGVALYVLAWITVPEEGQHDSWMSRTLRRDPQRVMVVGLSIAAVVTIVTMVGAIGVNAPNPFAVIVISVLVIAGVAVFSRRTEPPVGTMSTAMPPPAAPPATAGGGAGYPPPTALTGPPGPLPPPPRPVRAPRSHLFAITMAVVAIAMGSLWILDATVLVDVAPSVYPGTALGIVAVALIAGAWYGRSRLLIFAGLVATFATIVTSVLGPGPYGERIYRPVSAADVQADYSHGVGRMVLHLDEVTDPDNLDGRTLHLDQRVGQLEVIVPSSVDATVVAHVNHGDISGPSTAMVQTFANGEEQTTISAPDDADPNVRLDLSLEFGEILITQYDCPAAESSTPAGIPTSSTIGDGHAAPACN